MRSNRFRFSSIERSRKGLFWAGAVGGAAVFLGVFRAEVADVSLAPLDQVDGKRVDLIEIVRGVKGLELGSGLVFGQHPGAALISRFLEGQEGIRPAADQPGYVLLDRFHILHVLPGGIRVVHAEVASPLKFPGEAEVQADRLGVTDVQVAIGLWGEAGADPAAVLAGLLVFSDDLMDKMVMRRRSGFGGRMIRFVRHSVAAGQR
jgi:hypothetical protein